MTIFHGLSLGVFRGLLLIAGIFVVAIVAITIEDLVALHRGKIRLIDASKMTQWIWITFFNGGGDGFV